MAQLAPEFLHDVFVSYSHADPERIGSSLLKDWSLAFARELESELRLTPGLSNTSVKIDAGSRSEEKFNAADPLTVQVRTAVSGSAFLLILMSPHYVNSRWCTDERFWWLNQSSKQPFPEVGSRVFVARIWPTDDGDWPKELCDERLCPPLGVFFHTRSGAPNATRPFSWPDPSLAGGEFRESILTLAGQLSSRLKRLQEVLVLRRRAATEASKLSANGGQAIFVHARARNKIRWEEACHQLVTAGYGVFPVSPESGYGDPREGADAENEIIHTLSACDGLLLVPDEDQRSFIADIAIVGHQLRNSARARARKPLPCAILDRGVALEANPRFKQSIKNLNIDWIDGEIPDWTTSVRHWLSGAATRSNIS
jgi:hypothetical protein